MARRRRRRGGAEKITQGMALTEIGSAGVKHSSGKIMDDISTKLKAPAKRYAMFREIRDNSAPIGAARLAIEQLLRQTPVLVNAGGDDQADIDARDFVKSCVEDMSRSWDDTLAQSLTKLDFGFAPMEIVYKRRMGDNRDPSRRSRFTDGRIGWRKIVLRPQQTVDHWEFDESDGGIAGLWQRDPNGRDLVFIPIEKLLLFRTRDEGSPEGRSLYRNCVFPWMFCKHMMEVEGVGISRDLTGIPVMSVPAELLTSTTADQGTLNACKDLVTQVHRNEHEGILMPMQYNKDGHPLFKLELMTTGGRRQIDISDVIQRYEQRMLMCLLADFILLGHEQVGSFSLSSDKTDLFAIAVASWLESILEVWNRFAIPRLLALNGMKVDAMPYLSHGDIEKPDLAALGQFLVSAASAGVDLSDDDGALSRHIRELGSLPVPPMDDEDDGARQIGKRANPGPAGILKSVAREMRELRDSLKAEAA